MNPIMPGSYFDLGLILKADGYGDAKAARGVGDVHTDILESKMCLIHTTQLNLSKPGIYEPYNAGSVF